MEQRSLVHSALRFLLAGLAVAAALGALTTFDRRRALRMIGLAVYCAAVNKGWPDGGLLRASGRASGGPEGVVPYWGRYEHPPAFVLKSPSALKREPIG